MFISLVPTNLLLFDEEVRLVSAEGGPVLAELAHGDQVGGAGGEGAGGAEECVAMVLPPGINKYALNVLTSSVEYFNMLINELHLCSQCVSSEASSNVS